MFGQTPVTTTQPVLNTNQFPASAVYVPDTANGNFTVMQGGPVSAVDANGNVSAPAAVYVPDGNQVTLGQKSDSAATDSASAWSAIALMKGIIGKLLTSIAVTQSGTWTVQPGNTANTTAWLVDEAAAQGPVNITVAGGASGGTSPTFTGTCTANTDNSITFASKVRKVQLYNQSTVNVPYEHDITASAISPYLAPGTLVYVDVHTTTVHVYPPNALPINAANGLIVRGWA